MSEQKVFPTIHIKVPVQCIICGKVAESERLMHRLGIETSKKNVARLHPKYLGRFVCSLACEEASYRENQSAPI